MIKKKLLPTEAAFFMLSHSIRKNHAKSLQHCRDAFLRRLHMILNQEEQDHLKLTLNSFNQFLRYPALDDGVMLITKYLSHERIYFNSEHRGSRHRSL